MIKKLTVLFLLFLSTNAFAYKNNEVVVKFGITPYSVLSNDIQWILGTPDHPYTFEKTPNEDMNVGTLFYFEYFRYINSGLYIGIGFSQQFSRDIKDNGNLYSTDIYLTPKVTIYKNIYATIHLGISYIERTIIGNNEKLILNFNWDKKSIGLHYGAGIGYSYKNFIFEFLYSLDNATYKVEDDGGFLLKYENHMSYHTFNFNVGYKFTFGSDIQIKNKDTKGVEVKKTKKP
jgi:hypothetical protein